jgi:prepilin-type N-terminal cleavage/methylation domain-containing protein
MDSLLRKNKGITLIELLVALTISGVLVGAIYRTFIGQQKTYTVQERVVDMQQNLRASINRMMTEIRMAGFGNVSMVLPDMNTKNWGGKNNWDVVNPDYPAAGSVTILFGMASTTIIGGIPVPVSITAPPVNNQVTVNSLTDSQGNNLFCKDGDGDQKYVSIGGVESYIIKDIQGTTLFLDKNLTYAHQAGTPVYGIRAVSYQVDGTLTLLRDEIPRPSTQLDARPQPVADNIENLQFGYFMADGITQTANPPDIRNIQVTLRARTDSSDPDYKSDGGYRKRQIASRIHLKNMGLEL